MSDPFQTESFDTFQSGPVGGPPPSIISSSTVLPTWLARRLLGAGEHITWVRGPRLSPWWERYMTHPALFLVAGVLAAAVVGAERLSAGSWSNMTPVPAMAAASILLACIFVLGIAAGYFTRLVVTNSRVVILQGYEVCRVWDLDELPPALIRHGAQSGGENSRTVDLDALKTALGCSSDQFIEAKTILAFGRKMDRDKRP